MHGQLASLVIALFLALYAQDSEPWTAASVDFRPVGVITNGEVFWAFGSDEGIASSADGKCWHPQHRANTLGGPLLLGLEFPSAKFGFAYGTGGHVLFTADSGQTWSPENLGTETILAASFSDPSHGIFRTASSIFYVADGNLHAIPIPPSVPKSFVYAPAVAALSPQKFTVALSEGWRSRTGFVSTTDAGRSWTFYEPPHITTYDLVVSHDHYWIIGNETVDYDKPGGGYGVPAVMSSSDGQQWQHTTANIHPCHWEGCHDCNATACLVSSSMLIRPFVSPSSFNRIPPGHLTSAWAANANTVCTVDGKLYCAPLAVASDLEKVGEPQPSERILPRLEPPKNTGALRCIACGLDPVFVDPKVGGQFAVHFAVLIGVDGVPESVNIEKAPSPAIEAKMRAQMLLWLFEPPTKDGKPVKVSSQGNMTINVLRNK